MMLGVGGRVVSGFRRSFLFFSFAFLMITHDTLASNFILCLGSAMIAVSIH